MRFNAQAKVHADQEGRECCHGSNRNDAHGPLG
jgi:hypothetical protein